MSGSPREEAERLVASVLGAAAVAVQTAEARQHLRDLADRVVGTGWFGPSGGAHPPDAGTASAGKDRAGYATGSAECCLCPVCRVITALRDPSPEFAERLATGAGDLAVGLTGLLRAFGSVLGPRTPGAADTAGQADPWQAATRGAGTATATSATAPSATATSATATSATATSATATSATATSATAPEGSDVGASAPAPTARPMARKVAKKAVRPVVKPAASIAPESGEGEEA